MGLDMYLKKTKKIEHFTAKQYELAEELVSENMGNPNTTIVIDLEKLTNIKGANTLLEVASNEKYGHWYSIFEEVGYWRKANQIHHWFVNQVQDGNDDCQLSVVPKEKLEELYEIVGRIKKNPKLASTLLPTQEGFFFGSTSYDQWYYDDIELTYQILSKVLQDTDFENETVFYRASW